MTDPGTLNGGLSSSGAGVSADGKVVVGTGGFAFDMPGMNYRRNSLRPGLGLEEKLKKGSVFLMLNASTDNDGPRYWVNAAYRINW